MRRSAVATLTRRVRQSRILRWLLDQQRDSTRNATQSQTNSGKLNRHNPVLILMAIPLNDEAFEILVAWHSRFKDVKPDHYVFPGERYGFNGHKSQVTGAVKVYDLDPTKPMASIKSAWTTCRKAAGVWCRLHDFRHTFISALGEVGVPDSTIKALAGWMSTKMLERYSHTGNQAKRDAVSKLPTRRPK